MIRDINDNVSSEDVDKKIKMNIYLKNGDEFINCDIPSRTISEHENFISFWLNDKLQVYPISLVNHYELFLDN